MGARAYTCPWTYTGFGYFTWISNLGHLNQLCVFLDHKSILFSTYFSDPAVTTSSMVHLNRYFSSQSCVRFAAFYSMADPRIREMSLPTQDVNRLFNCFNQKCLIPLNRIAVLKPKRIISKPQPWLNDSTRFLRKAFRRAEQKWCKNKLHVSY